MVALEIPEDSTDPIQLADLLELQAIIAADRNSSQGDLEAILRIPSVLESYSSLATSDDLESAADLTQVDDAADEDWLVEVKTLEVFS